MSWQQENYDRAMDMMEDSPRQCMEDEIMGDWIVKMRRTVLTEVYVYDCTKAQAETDPFAYSQEEREIDQEDYKVLKVEPNE